jgi:hypothetical protein
MVLYDFLEEVAYGKLVGIEGREANLLWCDESRAFSSILPCILKSVYA